MMSSLSVDTSNFSSFNLLVKISAFANRIVSLFSCLVKLLFTVLKIELFSFVLITSSEVGSALTRVTAFIVASGSDIVVSLYEPVIRSGERKFIPRFEESAVSLGVVGLSA